MTDRDPALEPFDALIGTWATEATHHPQVDAVVTGTVTFEWLEGGHFFEGWRRRPRRRATGGTT